MMTNEQNKEVLNKLIGSEEFEDAINEIVDVRLRGYEWLKDKYSDSDIEHIYRCKEMDENENNDTFSKSVVYFIRNQYNGLLKIGKTNNLARRINEIEGCFTFLGLEVQKLQLEAISYCPFGMNNGQVESYYHKLFADKRVTGEWFDITYDELFNTLIIDDVYNGVLVTIEDPLDFPNGVKNIDVIEKNEKTLYNSVKNDLIDRMKRRLCIYDMGYMFKCSSNKIKSEDIINYIYSIENKEQYDLDKKIQSRIEEILSFLD